MLYFLSDYTEGAHPKVLEQLCELNMLSLPGYGEDPCCYAAKEKVSVIELKSTDEGYRLYQSVGFEDMVSKYHVMRVRL